MAAADVAVRQVVDLYSARQTQIRARVEQYVRTQWTALGSWDRADIERFTELVSPVVEAGQLQVAAITDGYLAAVESMMTGSTVSPVGVPADLVSDLAMRGVATPEVYARSGPTVWKALAEGTSYGDAVAQGLTRALSAAAVDMQLAHTHAARHVLSKKPHVSGYRRVLTGSKSCRLCVTASTQRYNVGKLQPIHTHCDCKVMPIIGDNDPGQVINSDLLAELHRQGISGDLALSQQVSRTRKSLTKTDDLIDSLKGDLAVAQGTDRQRIESRIADAEARRDREAASLERKRAQLADFRGENGKPQTVIVHTHGELGPLLTDSAHTFTSKGEIEALG